MLKSKLILVTVVLVLSISLYAQGDQTKKPEAHKFAEFGLISKHDLQNKTDALYSEVEAEPNSQGFIINYGSAARIRARKNAIRKTINPRCYDCVRVTFLDGPEKRGIWTVLWIAPSGADWPQP